MRHVLAGMALVALSAVAARGQEGDAAFLGRTADEWTAELTSGEQPSKVLAAWAIAQLAPQAAGTPAEHIEFARLVTLTSDRDAAVRYWGVTGLAAYAERLEAGDSGRASVASTLGPLLGDAAPAPRIAAALAIGKLGQPDKAVPVLIAAMSHPQDAVRIQAVSALETLGAAARPAEQALRDAATDSSEYVKRISARTLEKLD